MSGDFSSCSGQRVKYEPEVWWVALEVSLLEVLVILQVSSNDADTEYLKFERLVVRLDELVKHWKVIGEVLHRAGRLLIVWHGIPR